MNHLPNYKLLQVGYIVKDAKRAAEAFSKVFGLKVQPPGPFGVEGGYKYSNTKVRGIPTNASGTAYHFMLGDVDIEFIELTNDSDSIWKEFLEETGGGIHHIAVAVDDHAEAKVFMESKGYNEIMSGCWESGNYAYYAVEDADMIVEVNQLYNEGDQL